MRKLINMYFVSPNIYMHAQTELIRANRHNKVRN